ncbi:DUF2798 domain-containing protein [Fructobacillus sp. M1-13]|uniref:DUF2798 domain-containing protein n=1 Tax=Fructobacillus papyriferae TaxID=2713171 RepID=A0ABS5QQL9_9LACO|nr:DUF2798 domain-containing protein [Fructobacillus papyriferae]MBS9334696.1 DUF2798 domain-containing protein [Fructobacillus papyriferae]MCD2158686.1 DUF2798 domain-containing protein [Fructobacillus papyriferae]
MPRNLKEELVFMLVMAGLMVLGMSIYNVYLAQGIDSRFWSEIVFGYPIALIVAMLLDGFLVGPIAKGIAFKAIIPRYKEKSPIKIGITISVLMVLGMVTCMSLFGVLINGQSVTMYGHAWIMNLILALPLQLIVVAPIARTVLRQVQAKGETDNA